jgi:TonB family protein
MAFRALLFSKNEETNAALVSVCAKAGIRLEVCEDIFAAIDKGTKQAFSCVMVDWAGQPEAGFLLKRSRESGPNKSLIAIAVVDHDPSAADMRDHRLDFLIHRPIVADETLDLLTKASQKMQEVSVENVAAVVTEDNSQRGDERQQSEPGAQEQASSSVEPSVIDEHTTEEIEGGEEAPSHARNYAHMLRNSFAAVLALTAILFLWNARDAFVYLARTPEDRVNVLRESVAAAFYMNPSGAQGIGAASTDAQQDAYFSRGGSNSAAQSPQIKVVATEADLAEEPQLRKSADIPLPTPEFQRPEPEPVYKASTAIPESLRNSAPIAPPVVVTVNPAQMMPVSLPSVAPVSTQNLSEPIALSEESERALLIQSVNPVYPPEAVPQKLQGTVVLQATIGRDGNVEDLKIVRGLFVLGKSAAAAVKQWRFQPYTFNGHAVQTQTTITLHFAYPPS